MYTCVFRSLITIIVYIKKLTSMSNYDLKNQLRNVICKNEPISFVRVLLYIKGTNVHV